jgi:hypothetical protein
MTRSVLEPPVKTPEAGCLFHAVDRMSTRQKWLEATWKKRYSAGSCWIRLTWKVVGMSGFLMARSAL